jgi:chaperonin cofactor prefoldin
MYGYYQSQQKPHNHGGIGMKYSSYVYIVLALFSLSVAQAAPSSGSSGSNGNPYKTHGNPFVVIKAQTDELFASVDTIEGRVTVAEQNIAELEQKAEDLQQQILSNSGNIESLETELANTNSMIYILQEDLKQLKKVVDLKQDIIEGKCPNGEYVSQIKTDGSLVCSPDAGATGLRRYTVYKDEYLKGCFCWPGQSCACSTRPSGTISATCPAGSTAIGGGHTADLSVNVTASELRGNSWSVDAGLWPLFYYSGGYVAVHATCIGLN